MHSRSRGIGGANGLFVALGVLVVWVAMPLSAHAQVLNRLSAKKTAFDGNAILLPSGTEPGDAGVISIYDNTVTVPGGTKVATNQALYVTISANGLGRCDGIALNCQVDGANCISGKDGIVPSGWVVPLGNEFDGDSNFGLSGVNYQWCTSAAPGSRHIQIFGATEFGDCDTFLQAVVVYVDASAPPKGSDNCGTYTTPNSTSSPD